MKSLRSFERRLEKVEARMKAAEEAKAERDKVEGLEEVLERSEPCAFCLAIMQERFEVDINGRKRK